MAFLLQLLEIDVNMFRNHINTKFKPHPLLNIITGKNAQGKTNLIEAIFFNLTGYSYRANSDKEVINWNSDYAKVTTVISKNNIDYKQSIVINKDGKKSIFVNNVKKKIRDVRSCVVLFTPNDLELIKGSSTARRNFLDKEAGFFFDKYQDCVRQYNRMLYHRNHLLKNIYDKKSHLELDAWTSQLVSLGTDVLLQRFEILKAIIPIAIKWHSIMTKDSEKLEIHYLSSVEIEGALNEFELKSKFLNALKHVREKEIKKGYTVIGPHRDDLIFLVNGKDVKIFGSQGQQRTVVLSLKLALISLYKNNYGLSPILLLDDVFFELDEDRQEMLLCQIEKGMQTFITTNNFKASSILKDCSEYIVENGRLSLIS